ncbi:MAG TPA: hypothetical protein VFE54_14930 [Mucilaginibacter sp.]|jgi:hypothetical protein|nr:hypothetical protein [Mucilaginibacter sp.]
MKKFIYCLLAAALALSACKKETVSNGSSGIGSIYRSQLPDPFVMQSVSEDRQFTPQDSLTALGLMSSNNLSTNGYLFYAYQYYNALNQDNQMALYQIAIAEQIRNGLPIFFQDMNFAFENGKLNQPMPVPVVNISLDNKPTLSLQRLRDSFIKVDNLKEGHDIDIKDSILVAQLGYYNTNLDWSDRPVNFIKTWYVHPKNSDWPKGYFRDDNGSAFIFDPLTHNPPFFP